jgi:hypothetical protein
MAFVYHALRRVLELVVSINVVYLDADGNLLIDPPRHLDHLRSQPVHLSELGGK